MRMYDIIEKKKRGGSLTAAEIDFFIDGVTSGSIPDYQISAFLMAVYFKSMSDAETAYLTEAMARSGEMTKPSEISKTAVDKHSTGGVGDKTTLIAAPIAAALGARVAKMSGRGLGHTGGTVDKLEAVPGFNTSLTHEEFVRQINDIGIAVTGQTGNMVPADKRLYALRDVTATVDSVPLIASSIMSKKLASGCKNIVLDVKYGSGAFMKTADEAVLLAEKMLAIGKSAGRNVAAVVSAMESPLGSAVGNSVEIAEAAEVLKGGGDASLRELSLTLAALMYSLSASKPLADCRRMCEKAIADGSAVEKFRELITAQGGDARVIDNPQMLAQAKNTVEFTVPKTGFVTFDAERVGTASGLLGAGRAEKGDKIDLSAGIILKKKTGDYVRAGETAALLLSNGETAAAMQMMASAVKITDESPCQTPLIYRIIQ